MKDAQPGSGAGRHEPIDWTKVRRRLEDSQAAAERALNPSVGEKERILRARAVELGREPTQEKKEESLKVVTFLLAYETYAIETRWVREIFPLRELTPLPWNPPFVAGIVNLRGKILPVIDIKKLFDLPEKGLPDLNKVLVIYSGELELGILADQVLDMRSVPLSMIQSSLPTLTGIRGEYLKGVTAERLVILDAGRVLTNSRLSADGAAEERVEEAGMK
jgi:purine-binding chemotaxis protein CheW